MAIDPEELLPRKRHPKSCSAKTFRRCRNSNSTPVLADWKAKSPAAAMLSPIAGATKKCGLRVLQALSLALLFARICDSTILNGIIIINIDSYALQLCPPVTVLTGGLKYLPSSRRP